MRSCRYSDSVKLEQARVIFRALSDGTRLKIMNLLSEGELCVCDVMRVLKEPQSKVSRHLAYLRRAGLVKGRKEGLWMHYELSGEGAKIFPRTLQVLCDGTAGIEEFNNDLNDLNQQRSVLIACSS